MANDDINVIIYKILRYLYECKKAGKRPRQEDIMYNASLLQIPESYWSDVLLDLSEKGLIKGINSTITKDGTLVYLSDGFGITVDGMKYVDENSIMAKVEKYLGCAFVAVITGLINR